MTKRKMLLNSLASPHQQMKQKARRHVLRGEMERPSDERLVKVTLEGDLAAFEELVRRYYGPLMRHTLRYLKQEDDAKDAVQETFLIVYKNLSRFDQKRRFSPWIYKIAQNYCIDVLRKRKKMVPLAVDIEDGGKSPLEQVADLSEREKLKSAVIKLPSKYKLPIIGFYFQNLSYAQLSNRLRVPEATIKTHIHRGKALLRKIFGENR